MLINGSSGCCVTLASGLRTVHIIHYTERFFFTRLSCGLAETCNYFEFWWYIIYMHCGLGAQQRSLESQNDKHPHGPIRCLIIKCVDSILRHKTRVSIINVTKRVQSC